MSEANKKRSKLPSKTNRKEIDDNEVLTKIDKVQKESVSFDSKIKSSIASKLNPKLKEVSEPPPVQELEKELKIVQEPIIVS